MIKTVIFDIDNTLYSYDRAHTVAFAALKGYVKREIGMEPEKFTALHKEMNQEIKERLGECAAIHNRLIRYQNLLEKEGLPVFHAYPMSDIYWKTLYNTMVPMKNAAQTLAALKEAGVRIGIGTDMTAKEQYEKLYRLGLLDYIDFIVTSEEVGEEKPSPKLFALCEKKAGCPAGECMFVGDSLKKDARGAAAYGMQGVWFNPEGENPDVSDVTVIHELSELSALI